MSTTTEIIPTQFGPETTFAIALSETLERRELGNPMFEAFRNASPTADDFARRGIPESALHD